MYGESVSGMQSHTVSGSVFRHNVPRLRAMPRVSEQCRQCICGLNPDQQKKEGGWEVIRFLDGPSFFLCGGGGSIQWLCAAFYCPRILEWKHCARHVRFDTM